MHETKQKQITYLDLHVVVEEDVPELQVSVDDAVDVQVMDALQQLCHIVASLGLSHRLSTLVELQQGLEILHFRKKEEERKRLGKSLVDNSAVQLTAASVQRCEAQGLEAQELTLLLQISSTTNTKSSSSKKP